MTGQELTRLTAALLLGAALAFPVGLFVAGREETPGPLVRRPQAAIREVFSPNVRDDPYVAEQLNRQVETLEAHCRETGALCAEARGARRRLEELAER